MLCCVRQPDAKLTLVSPCVLECVFQQFDCVQEKHKILSKTLEWMKNFLCNQMEINPKEFSMVCNPLSKGCRQEKSKGFFGNPLNQTGPEQAFNQFSFNIFSLKHKGFPNLDDNTATTTGHQEGEQPELGGGGK